MDDKYREDRKEAGKTIEVLTVLTRSEGWDILRKAVENQIELLKRDILITPLTGDNNVYVQEFNKGVLNGLTIALKLPHTLVEGSRAIFAAIPPDEKDDE